MMTLERYSEKRDFTRTSEPRGRKMRRAGQSFVVHKHAARRLHYDLRLEMDGVLRSWAVTRGPSLVAGEKRLAVHVEDHPLDYGDFEGTIPKGAYGAGTVIVWDRGTWSPLGDAARGYAKGHLEFTLHGEKLQGRWHLVRMQAKPRDRDENWLLIKAEDDAARSDGAPDITEEAPLSVKTGRSLDQVAEAEAAPAPKAGARRPRSPAAPSDAARMTAARPAALPAFLPPMLASLGRAAPSGARWLHEIKFDGYRLQARIDDGAVQLLTRTGLNWSDRFGAAIPAAFSNLPMHTALIDGEVVVETGSGASDFSALQTDLSAGRSDRLLFYGFDLMHLDGHDLTDVPLHRRKHALEQLLAAAPDPLRYSTHFEESGPTMLRHACRLSLEGVVSKLRDSRYRSGRGKLWIKSKCSARQEFVIGGYVPSTTARQAIGSLVLGVFDAGGLDHVGRVGTGFSERMAKQLFARLEAMRRDDSPFDASLTPGQGRGVRFVRPELVAEVEFRAWTADGHLRHASFRGLREDKPAQEIRREQAPCPDPAPTPAAPRVRLTHPDRVYWPDEGITKEGLADYYSQVWRDIAPFVVNRPLALLRCPDGIGGQSFFQKHAWKGMNPHIRQAVDPTDAADLVLYIDSLDGLIALVQSAALEIHPWGSSLEDWDRPDMITMDLDPGDGVAWPRVNAAAQELRQRFHDAGLEAFVKTSGGKGLHVVASLKPHATWSEVKIFAQAMARQMAADSPEAYVATISKNRRKGRILIDYLRNQRGSTAVAAYSPRARAGAAVSAPVDWEELGPDLGPTRFTVENLPVRLAELDADPWAGFRHAAAALQVPR